MWQTDYLKLAILTSCFKVLFIPAYRSTDFEVHRNWLAITHSLPVNAWYKNSYLEKLKQASNSLQNESTTISDDSLLPNDSFSQNLSKSEWTLDYPPLFAAMEFLLSQAAFYVDPAMLDINNLNYASWKTVTFQRLSVVFTDLVFLLAVYGFAKYFNETSPERKCSIKRESGFKNSNKESSKDSENLLDNLTSPILISLLFLTNSALFIVDHIHFQYNGVLFGILLLSVLMLYENRIATSAFLFSLLLCMKHIFLYIAPVYGVYMLKKNCISFKDGRLDKGLFLRRLIHLGTIVVVIFLITFLPFVLMGQGLDLLSRLFPFQRGLSHAYWAPNFWAIYNSVDKVLHVAFRMIDKSASSTAPSHTASMTGGMVQEFEHHVLPSIKPLQTFLLSFLFMLPSLRLAWKQKSGHVSFTRAAILCAFTSFLFGWHVHEKAILIVIIPLTLLSVNSQREAGCFLFLHCVSTLSILPLLFCHQEQLIKYTLSLFSILLSFLLLNSFHKPPLPSRFFQLPFMTSLESLYLIGLLLLEVYTSSIHPLVFKSKLEFLPLLLTSLYCSLGVVYSYVNMLWYFE